MEFTRLFMDLKKRLEDESRVPPLYTAVLWGSEDLLGGAVEALLKKLGGWRTIRIFDERGIDVLIREVGRIRPNLLIIKQENIIRDIHSLLRLIQGFPDIKIITINPDNNLVEVYDKHLYQIREISDLLSIIGGNPQSVSKGGEKTGKTVAPDGLQ